VGPEKTEVGPEKTEVGPKKSIFFFFFFLFNFKLESLRNIRGTQNAAIQAVIGLKIAKKNDLRFFQKKDLVFFSIFFFKFWQKK
jgi:hypothetical protein